MVLSRRSPADRRLEPVRYASVSPICSKGTTSHSRSNEVASARPLTIAAHAPARTNRESPSEGRASEGTSILCCWVLIYFLLSVCVAVASCVLAIASCLVHLRLGFEPHGRLRGPQRLLLAYLSPTCGSLLLPCRVLLTQSRLRVLRVMRHHPKGVLGGE